MASTISRTAAIEQVTLLTQPTEFPIVHAAVVESIVDNSARPDADGNLPDDEDWQPSYDLNAAAATVFEAKAALVANRYDTNTDGQGLSRSQLLAHFQSMARMYRHRIASVMRKQEPGPSSEEPGVEAFL